VRLAFVILLIATASAQQYGSRWRKEYEKEKNGPHGECRIDWLSLAPGLDYRPIECLGDPDGLDLHVVRVDPGGHSTQIYVEGEGKRVHVSGDPVPVFIYATRR